MTQTELYQVLQGSGIPFAYHHWEKPPKQLPWGVYFWNTKINSMQMEPCITILPDTVRSYIPIRRTLMQNRSWITPSIKREFLMQKLVLISMDRNYMKRLMNLRCEKWHKEIK